MYNLYSFFYFKNTTVCEVKYIISKLIIKNMTNLGMFLCFTMYLTSCKTPDISANGLTKYYLLSQKIETQTFGLSTTTIETNYEYDTTGTLPKLMAEYTDSYRKEYDYVSSSHILVNYLDNSENIFFTIDYYIDPTTKNVLREVLNDTLEYSYKYDARGFLIEKSSESEVIYEYNNENLIRKVYNSNYQEEFQYRSELYLSPFVNYQFGMPNKNILDKTLFKIINEDGTKSSYTFTNISTLNINGYLASEIFKADDYQSETKYEYLVSHKK